MVDTALYLRGMKRDAEEKNMVNSSRTTYFVLRTHNVWLRSDDRDEYTSEDDMEVKYRGTHTGATVLDGTV